MQKATFDLVHERLVMINVPTRESLLREMIALLRPGGAMLLEDVDDISYTCVPLAPSWTVLLDAFHSTFHAIDHLLLDSMANNINGTKHH